ncbi:hypothetical protein C1M51_09035 [Methylibium sp. Pch-M]|uniref:helix-turn-helix domain-containing protein n=1 Tax=Methylibium sp. Pch-M TaxID=2082386 RepID=UPI00101142A2|nr:helix-turn-helix transcriptional regulator [Methylibium sp. Pch-M]QAZ39567.1 hypothetical protein C1M51_09035 [Methylibium sp. Pch-M]
MKGKKYLKLPSALVGARVRLGLRQKTVAIDTGLGTSYLCALERGRRPVPADDVLDRLAGSFVALPQAAVELRWAATHDRVMQTLDADGQGDLAEVVSLAMDAARALSGAKRVGLANVLARALRSSRFLESLEARAAQSANADSQEAPIE